jgi:hypothetical protein
MRKDPKSDNSPLIEKWCCTAAESRVYGRVLDPRERWFFYVMASFLWGEKWADFTYVETFLYIPVLKLRNIKKLTNHIT